MKYLILVGLLLSSAAFGKAIFYGSETEQLRVKRYGTTLLRFDHQVKTISQAENFVILPADTNNPNYSLLSIKPRNSKSGTLTFILDNGAVVSLKVNVASRKSVEELDQFFDFKAKDQRINGKDRKAAGSNISDIDLMKAMIRNDKVTGYKSRPMSRWVRSGIKDIKVKLIKIYSGPRYNGYVFKVSNKGEKPYKLSLKELSLGSPNVALLSQVDKKEIGPKAPTTLLRIVSKPTSAYREIVLPIRVTSKK